MKKTYSAPETKVYKININSVLCTSPTVQESLKDDTEGQLSRENENDDITPNSHNIWAEEW